MTRREAEHIIIGVMYGAPGEGHDTADGRRLVIDLLHQMGLSALTDDAVIRLAGMHAAEDYRMARCAG